MVRFTIVNADSPAPEYPWQQVQNYKKNGTQDGRTYYPLNKYERDATTMERFACGLKAAWNYLTHCFSLDKKGSSLWEKANGRKKISYRENKKVIEKPDHKPEKEQVKSDPLFENYNEGIELKNQKRYGQAVKAFYGPAKAGHQDSADALRAVCEEDPKWWSNFYLLIRVEGLKDSNQRTLTLHRFSPQEQEDIKTAIRTSNTDSLFTLAQAFENQKKYPEASLCYGVAARFAHQPSMEALVKLDKEHLAPDIFQVKTDKFPSAQKLKKLIDAGEKTAELFLTIADMYSQEVRNFGEGILCLDPEIQSYYKTTMSERAKSYWRLAAAEGNGYALSYLKDDPDFSKYQKNRLDSLKKMETEARTKGDVSLFLTLLDEYQINERFDLDKDDEDALKSWADSIAKHEAISYDGFKHDRYKQVQMAAEAALRGSIKGMDILYTLSDTLPKGYFAKICNEYSAAVEPKIAELLAHPDIRTNRDKVEKLIELIRRSKNHEHEVRQWMALSSKLAAEAVAAIDLKH